MLDLDLLQMLELCLLGTIGDPQRVRLGSNKSLGSWLMSWQKKIGIMYPRRQSDRVKIKLKYTAKVDFNLSLEIVICQLRTQSGSRSALSTHH
jgi:hypothetical protein